MNKIEMGVSSLRALTPLPAGVPGWGLLIKYKGRSSFVGSREKPFVFRYRRVADLAAKAYDFYADYPPGTTRSARYMSWMVREFESFK